MLIALPDTLSINIGLPLSINAYRVILVMLVLFSHNKMIKYENIFSVPYIKIIIFVIISGLISTILSVDAAYSLNKYLGFSIAIYLYYFIVVRSIKNDDDIILILRYMVAGLIMVAIFGLLERYIKFSIVKYLNDDYYYWISSTLRGRVTSTYPHPILLGAGLSMGVPLMMYMTYFSRDNRVLRRYQFATLLLFGVTYFTLSRGAWLSIVLCFILSLFLLPNNIKKSVIIYSVVGIALLIINKGVFDTIYNLYKDTFNVHTLKGDSFSYRGELWRVAVSKILESPIRFIFGYGDGSHNILDIAGRLSYNTSKYVTFDSWDSEYACILLERGVVGFTIYLYMILIIMYNIIKSGLKIKGVNGILVKTIFISNFVLIFMMTNVKIFATQLVFLFWTNIAIAVRVIDRDRDESV